MNATTNLTLDFDRIHVLADEILNILCQVKAIITLINGKNFYQHDEMTLRNSLYALESMIDSALDSRDKICDIISSREKK